jgi:hypothetical protein
MEELPAEFPKCDGIVFFSVGCALFSSSEGSLTDKSITNLWELLEIQLKRGRSCELGEYGS